MHNPTFKSLEEIFSNRHEATTSPTAPQEPARKTLAALVEEAKTVLAKLEAALTNVISNEGPMNIGPKSRNLIRSLDSRFALARDDKSVYARDDTRVIEGVFDGARMIADDGTTHPVPENYASKSKLVEGDLLQYVETEDGRRYFKQISRAARTTVTALLERIDQTGGIATTPNGRSYQLLHAPLRFFRVTPGDSITLEIPVDGGTWAAVVGKAEACYTDAQRQSYARTLPNA